jgi:universal stress protein E
MASKEILVVVDPRTTEDQPVIERAAWLAARSGASLELFGCDYDSDIDAGRVAKVWSIASDARERLLSLHRQRLEDLAKPLRAKGLAVTVAVTWDYPLGDTVVRRVVARSPWLVAKDTAHHSLVQRTLLTSSDWHLIANCPVPLLLVKNRKLGVPPKVMVAVDPTHEHDKPAQLDDALFRFGEVLAHSADAELHLVHALSMPMTGFQLSPQVAEGIESAHREAVERFLRTHELPRPNVHLMQGLAQECLVRAATEQAADFVVMGAVARRGLSKLFIGSTANRTLDRLPCDLVIVKPAAVAVPAGR